MKKQKKKYKWEEISCTTNVTTQFLLDSPDYVYQLCIRELLMVSDLVDSNFKDVISIIRDITEELQSQYSVFYGGKIRQTSQVCITGLAKRYLITIKKKGKANE